jgi:hypothetical protein
MLLSDMYGYSLHPLPAYVWVGYSLLLLGLWASSIKFLRRGWPILGVIGVLLSLAGSYVWAVCLALGL